MTAKWDSDLGHVKSVANLLNELSGVQLQHERQQLAAYRKVAEVYQDILSDQQEYLIFKENLIMELKDTKNDIKSSNSTFSDEPVALEDLVSFSQTSTNALYDPSLCQSREQMDEEEIFEIIRDWCVDSHASSLVSSCANPDAPPSSSSRSEAKRCLKKENCFEEGIEEKKPIVLTPTVKKIKVKERLNQNEVVQEQPEDDDIKDNKENVRCKDYDDDLIKESNEDNNSNNNNNNNNNEDQLKEEGYSNKTKKKDVKENGDAITIKQTLINAFDTVIEVVKEVLLVTGGHIAKLFKFKGRTSESDKSPIKQDVKVEDPVDLIQPHTRKRKTSISTASISTVPAKKSKGASKSHGPDCKKSHSR